jgi:hypothetical protein
VIFKPEKAGRLGGPMNGQKGRRAIFLALARQFRPDAILETGAHRGVTTRFLAEEAHPRVLACEIDPRFYWEARIRLCGLPGTRVFFADTRFFLENLSAWEREAIRRPFFYLDAHWDKEDLPLAQELKIIHRQYPNALLCIDDFCHPIDSGYGYDSYGPGKEIGVDLIRCHAPEFSRIFVPRLSSREETGKKRGCAFLGLGEGLVVLGNTPTLMGIPLPPHDSRPDHF